MYRLKNWKVVTLSDEYKAPEQQVSTIGGDIYGNPNFKDGEFVLISKPVTAIGKQIVTISGSIYKLEEPDPEYLKYLERNGHDYDPENPIKIRS